MEQGDGLEQSTAEVGVRFGRAREAKRRAEKLGRMKTTYNELIDKDGEWSTQPRSEEYKYRWTL
jgi:hypothetical protein